MSTETTNKKIKIDNGTTFGRTYTDKAVDEKLQGFVSTATFTPVKEKADNSLQKPAGLTKTKLVGVGTNGQENIEIGDNLTLANGKLSASGGGSGGEGGISVIELTDKNGTIVSAQLGEINANPQNFAFKYKGKILLFTKADSTTYQYCNNTTSSSNNNVMTTSTLLTITSSTGVYKIAENVHNVVANSIHPANGGDLTNIQVGSKIYSIPSGGGESKHTHYIKLASPDSQIFFIYISEQAEKYTINTLKQVLNNRDKTIPCNGYWDSKPVVCFFGNGNSFQLGTVQNKAISFISEDFTVISDYVE